MRCGLNVYRCCEKLRSSHIKSSFLFLNDERWVLLWAACWRRHIVTKSAWFNACLLLNLTSDASEGRRARDLCDRRVEARRCRSNSRGRLSKSPHRRRRRWRRCCMDCPPPFFLYTAVWLLSNSPFCFQICLCLTSFHHSVSSLCSNPLFSFHGLRSTHVASHHVRKLKRSCVLSASEFGS